MPQVTCDVFGLLAAAGQIDPDLARRLQNRGGWRNMAVHDEQTLQLPITVAVITPHLEDFLVYSAALLRGR